MSGCVLYTVPVASSYCCRVVCSLPDVSVSCHNFSDVNAYGVVLVF